MLTSTSISTPFSLPAADDIGEPHVRLPRAATPQAPRPSTEGFVNGSGCIYFFSAGISGTVREYQLIVNRDGSTIKFLGQYNFTLKPRPTQQKAKCAAVSSLRPIDKAELNMDFAPATRGDVSAVNLNLVFTVNSLGGNWSLSKDSTVMVTRGGNTDKLKLKTSGVIASSGFSFSCGDMRLASPAPSNDTLKTIELVIKRFQVQPFTTGNARKIFAPSFDCATWTTIGTWTGMFTVILFTVIVAVGVYFLFEIKTMDRFENPKGKTITVAAGE